MALPVARLEWVKNDKGYESLHLWLDGVHVPGVVSITSRDTEAPWPEITVQLHVASISIGTPPRRVYRKASPARRRKAVPSLPKAP